MRLAVLQSPSPAGDVETACAVVEAALHAAAAAGAQVLTVPEVFLPGYNNPEITALALQRDATPLLQLGGACRATGCGLVIGYAEVADGAVWNSALYLDATGAERANYRKIQLYGPRENSLFRPGSAYVTFDLNGQKAAMLICYDVEFAPHLRVLADQGVTLLLVPTANMQPFVHVPRHTVPAMAANHGIAIAYANYCGVEGDLTYTGGSLIAGPHGEIMAQAGQGPALLIADLPARDAARLSSQSADFRTV